MRISGSALASQRRPDAAAQVQWLLAGDLNIEGGSEEYDALVQQWGGFQALGAPEFVSTYNTESFLTPPGWRDVEYRVCLDHMLTNIPVDDYQVLEDDLSDHRGLLACISVTPRTVRQSLQQDLGQGQVAVTPREPNEPQSRSTMAVSVVEGGLLKLMPQGLVAASEGALKLLGVWRGIDSTLALAERMGYRCLLGSALGQGSSLDTVQARAAVHSRHIRTPNCGSTGSGASQ